MWNKIFYLLFGLKNSPSPPDSNFSQLDPDKILVTGEKLAESIRDSFPHSGLLRVCGEFNRAAQSARIMAEKLSHPVWILRILTWIASALIIGLSVWVISELIGRTQSLSEGLNEMVQTVEAATNELILLGLLLLFLIQMEERIKRRFALQELHRLRTFAHVVDMHQLTKDPTELLGNGKTAARLPDKQMNRHELHQYLNYCSQLLSINSKIAALFAQNMNDPVVLEAVNDLENLDQGLAAKIWQKIMILDLAEEDGTEEVR
ncbi:MAG: hypothetical protein H6562_08370 [Lewinellaceae bacterium]|nr:hypothetical protein [Lewinella sp.]MCB9278914.1 hypothetical protein [Lewinellaceae bacterium]